jgi:hypothetical protein
VHGSGPFSFWGDSPRSDAISPARLFLGLARDPERAKSDLEDFGRPLALFGLARSKCIKGAARRCPERAGRARGSDESYCDVILRLAKASLRSGEQMIIGPE